VVPYKIYPAIVSRAHILKAKRLTAALELCTGAPKSVADKLRYARLAAGINQGALAEVVGVDRATLLRYENGQVSEYNMQVDLLVRVAAVCGVDKLFCCSLYHAFIIEDAGKQIKRWRKEMGLTQKEMAVKLGALVSAVKRWEQNKNKPPRWVWELVSGSIDM